MPRLFHRRLAIPIWTIALGAVALDPSRLPMSPLALLVTAAVGMTAIVFLVRARRERCASAVALRSGIYRDSSTATTAGTR